MERRLGRGLGSLLGTSTSVEDHKAALELDLDQIRPNPRQPRKVFNPVALEELAASIRNHGILQPIVVRSAEPGYEIISGERRWRAAHTAGLKKILALIRPDVSDDQMLELALVENLQRQDLDAMERARGYQQMMETLHLTQEDVARKVGLNRATVANHVRLLDLPSEIQQAVSHELLSMGHARALLSLEDPGRALKFLGRITREGLSVRQVERMVRESTASADPISKPKEPPADAPWIKALEERLRERLGTKVALRNRPGYRGQISIDYFDRADLDRVIEILAPQEEL